MSMECEKKKAPIGVFDSGVGGLTVVREITRQLPHENIVYFGDTARVPYGSKSKSNIIRFSEQIIRFLKTKQVKAIVIACNTASALALDAVRDEFDIPIIGVIVPGARAAVEATANGEIGVVGTDATVKSGTYTKVIHQMDPNIHVREKACPLFVPLVEEGFKEHVVTEEVIEYYLESLKHTEIDAMILSLSVSRFKNSRFGFSMYSICGTRISCSIRDSGTVRIAYSFDNSVTEEAISEPPPDFPNI